MYDEQLDSNREQGRSTYTILSLLIWALLLGVAVFNFTPDNYLTRHFVYSGEAENVVSDLKSLVRNLDVVNESTVRPLLETERYSELKTMEISIAMEPHEVIWFGVNDMYNIGLSNDGTVLGMVGEKRIKTELTR